ncbi:MAG: penicillin-binding protein, partial [Acidobacteria bacterium]
MNSNPQQANTFENLSRFVEENLAKWGIPGLAIGVVHKGEMAAAGFGITNIDHPLPVTDETLFQIGSVTKTYVGTAIMRLVEMGKLDLDATVQTYLPDFKVSDETASTEVTLRHLLTHTCGWVGDFFHGTGDGDDALASYVADMASLEQLASLGETFSYNNAAFSLLGRVIEVITGTTFEEALDELVLKPLGLENSYLKPTDVMTHRFVVGHEDEGDGHQVARPWELERSSRPMGAIVCHIKDLLRYARFHLGDGSTDDGIRILSRDSLTQMHSPQTTLWGDEHWGLSWEVQDAGGERQVSHGGATNGQIASLVLFPEHDFALAVVTNSQQGMKTVRDVTQQALKHYLGLVLPEPEAKDVSEEELAAYAGFYSRPYCNLELGLLAKKLVGVLTYRQGFPNEDSPPHPSSPPMTLAVCGPDRLMVTDGMYKGVTADLVRRDDGAIAWL